MHIYTIIFYSTLLRAYDVSNGRARAHIERIFRFFRNVVTAFDRVCWASLVNIDDFSSLMSLCIICEHVCGMLIGAYSWNPVPGMGFNCEKIVEQRMKIACRAIELMMIEFAMSIME